MILKYTKKTIIINAGHWDDPDTSYIDDPGATFNHVQEAIQAIKIRDLLVPMLESSGFKVFVVPDELDLKESIFWANNKAPKLKDALAVDIHLNYLSNTAVRGSEAFYGTSDTSRAIASALTDNVSKGLKIPNRGAKPDTKTAVGSLGWIRKTTMWASLIEVCFLTNKFDMEVLMGEDGHQKAALGIANGICEIFGVKKIDSFPDQPPVEDREEIKKQIINLVKKL